MNLDDVAKKAGVSTATVSRVLNKAAPVKNSTRARVLKAIEELKYYPNLHARSLAGGKNPAIGMIVSNLENPFFLDIFRALETCAYARGYELLVANTGYDSARLLSAVRLMIGRRVSGLAMIVSEMEPSLIRELTEARVRAAFYDVGSPRANIMNIRVDYRKGMQRIVEYLHDLRHRRMAFVGHHTSLGPLSARRSTFVETIERYTPKVQYTVISDDDSIRGGREAARRLLASPFQPTAILCANDLMAVGVLRELYERGIEVPDQMSVTGFDNIALSEYSCPSLTTAHIPRESIGRMVFEYLVSDEAEDGHTNGREAFVQPELIVRESTGSAPGA